MIEVKPGDRLEHQMLAGYACCLRCKAAIRWEFSGRKGTIEGQCACGALWEVEPVNGYRIIMGPIAEWPRVVNEHCGKSTPGGGR